jgi:hypothetical protein
MKMRGFWLGLAVGTIFTCLLGQWVFSAAGKETDPPKGIPAQMVADYIHSVVQADRAFYTTEIVERMQTRGIVFASEHWREDGDLPLPAQFLLESGRLVAKQSIGAAAIQRRRRVALPNVCRARRRRDGKRRSARKARC